MINYQSEEVTVIVGAGITGLTAAYHLAGAGEPCVVLEKNKAIGGFCRTFNMDDIIFDLGPHFFFDNPDFKAEKFMMSLLKDEEIIKKRFRFSIFRNGKNWKFPISISDMIFFPMEYKRQILSRLFSKRNKVDPGPVNAEQEMVEKLGIKYYEKTVAHMLQSKALVQGAQIHHDWLARVDRNVYNDKEPFMPISPIKHILITMKQILYQAYLYPREGYKVFPQKLWRKYRQLGGETVLGCGEICFEKDNDNIGKVIANDKEFLTKNVIWTGSINDLNDVLGSNAPRIKYVKVIIVFLSYNQKKRVRQSFGYIYHPDKNLIFNRIYYPSAIFGRQSPRNKEGVCFELNYMEHLDNFTDQEIIDRTVLDAETLGLFKKEQLRESKVIRLGECLPVYGLDYEDKIKETFEDVHNFQNLYSIGRLGGYYFCMTPAAVSQGMKMAGHLLQNKVNR